MQINGVRTNPLPTTTLSQRSEPETQTASAQALSAAEGEPVRAVPAPYDYGPGWYMSVAEVIEHSRGGIRVDDEIKVIDEPDEVRAARARQMKEDLVRAANFSYATSAPAVAENHDTYFPNVADLSLKWATAVRSMAQDMLDHPSAGTVYAHYGDQNSSSLKTLLGWLDEHIAKLSANPQNP